MYYKIKNVSKILGISIYTLRYYEKIGLLDNVKRNSRGQREFSEGDILTLNTVECLKQTGMPLKMIKEYVDLIPQGLESVEERLAIMEKQQKVVSQKIQQWQKCLDIINGKVTYYTEAVKHHQLDVCHDEKSALVKKILKHNS